MKKKPSPTQYEFLDWDSKHFGYPVVKVVSSSQTEGAVKKILNDLSSEVRLVYWFVDPDEEVSNIEVLENGGLLVDEKLTYVQTIPERYKTYSHSKQVRPYLHKTEDSQIIYLAQQAGACSRYKIDPNFMNNEYKILYTEWIKKSLSGDLAKEVFLYELDGVKAGLVTLGEKNKRGEIGLIAVDNEFRRSGIGKKLMCAAFAEAHKLGYSEMQVVTQKANVIANRFYERLGFSEESTINIYHFWLNEKKFR